MIAIPMRVSDLQVCVPVGVTTQAGLPVGVTAKQVEIPATVGVTEANMPVAVSATQVGLPVGLGAAYQMREGEIYDGEYEFTPTQETQTVFTKDKTLLQNITINPIPSNYGLITYNGAFITVS